MKKFLNISVIAALAILPLAANAAVVAGDPTAASSADPVQADDTVTASASPKYALAESDSTDGVVATAGYVKGAYNAAIKAINKVSETAGSALQKTDITTGVANGTIAVDGTDVAVKGLGSAAYENTNAFISSADGSVKTANIDDGQVTKAKLATDVQTSLDGAIQSVQLNGAALTETNGVVNVTAVQSVTTGTTSGTVKVDDQEVAVAGWSGKQDALDTAQMAAVNSGIDATKRAAYDQLVTDSGNYATKTGVTTTVTNAFTNAVATITNANVTTGNAVSAATVPVVTTWGATAPATTGVSVNLTQTEVVTNVSGTAAVTPGAVQYPAN